MNPIEVVEQFKALLAKRTSMAYGIAEVEKELSDLAAQPIERFEDQSDLIHELIDSLASAIGTIDYMRGEFDAISDIATDQMNNGRQEIDGHRDVIRRARKALD
jgi:hypothetical protein